MSKEEQAIKTFDDHLNIRVKLVEAYETDHRIIVMYGNEVIPESHNCDEMGCSSVAHVKYRLTKPDK